MNIIIVNCFDTYEHRVDLLYKILSEEGNSVKVLGSDFRHFEKNRRTDIKENYIFFECEPYYKNMSVQRLHSHSKLSQNIFKYVKNIVDTIDLLWVLVPPNSVVENAAKLKKKYPRIKLVFDLIDLWPETMPIPLIKNIWPLTIWKNIRDKYLKYADYVVTECSLYKDVLRTQLSKIKTDTLYLARPINDFVSESELSEDTLSLCYLGSINNIIDIDFMEQMVREIQSVKPVEMHIIGDGERRQEFISRIEKVGASVTYYGKVYDNVEKKQIFDKCHYGLNIMKDSVCVGLTMKSIDYFEAGLPIINNIKGDTWNFVEEEHLGINADEPSKIICEKISSKYDMRARIKVRGFYESTFGLNSFKGKLEKIVNDL